MNEVHVLNFKDKVSILLQKLQHNEIPDHVLSLTAYKQYNRHHSILCIHCLIIQKYATSSPCLIFDLSTKEPVVIVSSSSPISNPNSNKHTKVKKKRKGANAAALLHSEEICPTPVVLQESESVQSGGIIIVDNVEDNTNDYIDLKQVEEDEPTFDDQVVLMFCGLC